MKNAMGYARVSTEEQGDSGVSLDNQVAKIHKYSAREKMYLIESVTEVKSGGEFAGRVALQAVLNAVEKGEIQAVIVNDISRLSRDMLTLLALERSFDDSGVELHTVDGIIQTNSPNGFMSFAMQAFMGEMERRQIKYRTKQAMAHKKASGQVVGSIPYGYHRGEPAMVDGKLTKSKVLVSNPKEQETRATATALFLSGKCLSEITNELNAAGNLTRTGRQWNPKQVSRIIEGYVPSLQPRKATIQATRTFIQEINS